MQIFTREQIERAVCIPEILEAIESGFVAFSRKQTVIPPVATLPFQDPPGVCHIKYGYAKEGKHYVVKIASGFPENPKWGLPTTDGLMLLFEKASGQLAALLLDEGYLTELRTAAAGAIAAKYMAPQNPSRIGIVGTGTQAYFQLKLLSNVTQCRKVMVWGRDTEKAQKLKAQADLLSFEIEIAPDLDTLADQCSLIVTTTSSDTPLLFAHQIRPGTHITAVGADEPDKQELDPALFAKADRAVVDSRDQCLLLGEASRAVREGFIKQEGLIELGEVIINPLLSRKNDSEITIADLTGVAIQDLQIATSVLKALSP